MVAGLTARLLLSLVVARSKELQGEKRLLMMLIYESIAAMMMEGIKIALRSTRSSGPLDMMDVREFF
jgi:hypothetical protein